MAAVPDAPEGAPPDPTASGSEPKAESAPAAEALPGSALSPDSLKVGLEREALVQALGSCGERVKFIEPRSYRRALEIFQPKDGDCAARFGERHFVVVGDRVAQVEEGLRPRPVTQPAAEPRSWGDSSIPR